MCRYSVTVTVNVPLFMKYRMFKRVNGVKVIKSKCSARLNILKSLSHKSWKLSKKILISNYTSLVGCKKKSLQAIKNNAVITIYHISKLENLSTCNLKVSHQSQYENIGIL